MTSEPKRVSLVGLGAMGLPMGQTLVRNGFKVAGFDLNEDQMKNAELSGIHPVTDIAAIFDFADIVVFSLPAAQQVRQVIEQSGLLDTKDGEKVVVDTSTSEPEVSRRLAEELGVRGHGFLDAPVSGGPTGSASGQLSFMIGGDEQWVVKALPVLNTLGSKVLHVGSSGAGNVAKLVNNMLVACHMLTTAEGLRLAQSAGVSAAEALRVINAASGRTMLSEVHFPNWVLPGSFASGFSTGLMRKDLRLALQLAQAMNAQLPVARLVQELWSEDRSGIADQDDFTRFGDPTGNAQIAREKL